MSTFFYTAKSQPNKTIQGQIEADSKQDAIAKLSKLGYFPILVESQDLALEGRDVWHFRRVPRKDIVLLTNQMSNLIASGINIINSLIIIFNQTPNRFLKSTLKDIIKKIKDGQSLSESFAGYPQIFSNLYIAMLHSGEVGGNIDVTLKRLADFLEKEEDFKNSVRAALIYPIFIFVLSVMTVIVLLVFVIPRLSTMFEDMGQMLPLPTKILMNTSRYAGTYWWFILSVVLIFIFLGQRLQTTTQGKILLDRLKLKIPLWRDIVLKTEISRVFRTLSLLLSNGIPIVSGLDVSTSILENQILKINIQKIKEQISGGMSFSSCLAESGLFSPFVINVIAVGEETGNLEKSLARIADEYERVVDGFLKTLPRFLEPIIILIMGLVVGFIVLSILLPIFQINLIVT